jgi:hypothetical protein
MSSGIPFRSAHNEEDRMTARMGLSALAMLSALGGMEPIIQIVPDKRKRIKKLSASRPEGSAVGPKKRGKLPRSKRKK